MYIYKTLQHAATHCNTPQHTATHCNTLGHTRKASKQTQPHGIFSATIYGRESKREREKESACRCASVLQQYNYHFVAKYETHLSNSDALHVQSVCLHTATHCNTLHHSATLCNTLQHTATTHCNNTLQHTATHCNTLKHTAPHCNTAHCNTLQRAGRLI